MTAIALKKPERPISEPVGRRILSVDQLDDLGEAIIALTREVYVLTDRLVVLEAVLEKNGIAASAEIDRFVVSPELQAKLNIQRDKIIGAVLGALRSDPAQPQP
jgi:hypothetical protein